MPATATAPSYSNVIIPPPATAANKAEKGEEKEAVEDNEEDLDKMSLLERVRKMVSQL